MFFFILLVTLSWGRPLSYRNQSNGQWTGFYMIMASVMKVSKWGKNEEKYWVQHILWSSKILFCFWINAYIFFSNGHIRNVVSTFPNVEKHNVVSTLFYVKFPHCHTQRCFNVDLTLRDFATSYQPKNNVELTLKCLLGIYLISISVWTQKRI